MIGTILAQCVNTKYCDISCDLCKTNKAVVDSPTVMGPWAYMCESCLKWSGKPGEFVSYKKEVKK